MQYLRKQTPVEARQWLGTSDEAGEIIDWLHSLGVHSAQFYGTDHVITVWTQQQKIQNVSPSMFIVVFSPDSVISLPRRDFEAQYVAVEEEPEVTGARLFHLERDEDETGISGTGTVAEGTVYSDGTVTLRWVVEVGSTGVYADLAAVEKIHGHEGKTRIVFD